MTPFRPSLPARLLMAVCCAAGLLPLAAQADPPGDHRGRPEYRVHDGRPGRGAVVPRLPHGHRTTIYRGTRYYYGGGMWYRPYGGRFVVVAPPVGIVVPVLPAGVVTLSIGGRPYYRYDDVYYVRRGDGYIVVDPPASDDDRGSTLPPRDELFIYPNRDQSERQQRNDRFECHEWAAGQTGYDPTLAGGGRNYSPDHRTDYLRAMSACLEGRGYTVR